jgi:Ca2+-binding EF-hand superfamily protein
MKTRLIVSAVALVLVAVLPADAQGRGRGRGHAKKAAAIRFQEMDRNNDRVIARSEWQGSDQSFKVHDWDGDGVLSGDEVRVGAERAGRGADDLDFDAPDREYRFDDWTTKGFASLDHNRDGRVAREEWHFDRETFRRADHNNDGAISRAEFLGTDAVDDDRAERFVDLDIDRNGQISRTEWHGSLRRFEAMDANHDGAVTRVEMLGAELPPELFSSVDVNRDGAIELNEWHWSRAAFDRRDLNHDARITREEFKGPAPVGTSGTQGAAYKAGYDRGETEARAQAREDRVRNQGYDAEGQRELETADSGYEPRFGPKADYQAGYRAGWRRGYPEGWRLP